MLTIIFVQCFGKKVYCAFLVSEKYYGHWGQRQRNGVETGTECCGNVEEKVVSVMLSNTARLDMVADFHVSCCPECGMDLSLLGYNVVA